MEEFEQRLGQKVARDQDTASKTASKRRESKLNEDESDETRTSIRKPSKSNPSPTQIENSKFWEHQEFDSTWILNAPEVFKYMFCVFPNESLYLF